ncbi:glycosyltransferase family 4 protein [Haloarcula litorea]|uniref:glycosyltransferase family 4 protein n=1 Tax=Haloarcula litorea TaxID=3032579 RepID=UPI0023E8EC28|nr:glycosyltransferase family 4 protein [Halomicroarcula sp. GDY20]
MASIAVFHPNLASRGGGEAVCMNVLQTLQNDHDLTLVTVSEPNLSALNDYYDTDVREGNVEIDRARLADSAIDRLASLASLPETRLWKLRSALLKRVWEPSPYDLVVSTYNEFTFDIPAVQYIHYPNAAGPRRELAEWAYLRTVESIDGHDPEQIRSSMLLANSGWTASVTDDVYGVHPKIIYPPVDTSGFDPLPWTERENGFVAVGRVEPTKNILRLVRIIERVRSRSHDVHLHIAGPLADSAYARRVRRQMSHLEFVTLEGELDRATLCDLIASHRYGIHGKEKEHFGMAIAELLAGGTVPFVPDSGGQREVVDETDTVLYRSATDAVETICGVLSLPDGGEHLRSTLPDIDGRFGREQFREQIATVVDRVLTENSG